MIQLKNIHKTFQDGERHENHVLNGVNLELAVDDFVAIKGESGAGKTTLLNIMGTLLQPDEGEYWLDGRNIVFDSNDIPVIRNRKIGFVFQDHRLMPAYTIIQNILLPTLATAPKATPEAVRRAKELMELTGITGIANLRPDTISGGEASRAAVCRALIMQPLLLLADEPTGQLDRENAQNIARLLQRVNERLHTTIVMVTHSDETAAVAKRILTLKDGILR